MAITIDAISSGSTGASAATSLTVSHINAGDFLSVSVEADSPVDPTGVTFNGISLTKAVSVNGGLHSSIWYMSNPTITTANIVITFAGSHFIVGGGISLKGTNTGGALGITGTGTGSTNNASITLSTTGANSWLVDSIFHNRNSSRTFLTNVVNRFDVYNSTDNWHGIADTLPTTTTGSYTIGETMGTPSDGWAACAIEVLAGPTNYSITCTVGTFTETGINAVFNKVVQMLTTVGQFLMTGINATFSHTGVTWTKQNKSATPTYTHSSKSSTIWTKEGKS